MKLVLSLEQIEANLEAGAIKAVTISGRLWSTRRNGRTKIKGLEFSIPVKVGFKSYAYITNSSRFATSFGDNVDFVVETVDA